MSASSAQHQGIAPEHASARWRPVVFGALALLALLAVLALALMIDGDSTRQLDPDQVTGAGAYTPWLWVLSALGTIALVLSMRGWRKAEMRADLAQQRVAAISQTVGGQRELVARRESQLAALRRLTGWFYWEQDESGRYRLIETGTETSLERFRQLLGTEREAGARADEPDRWHQIASQIEHQQDFQSLRWRRALVGKGEISIEEHGQARFDAQGRFIGYAGVMREHQRAVTRNTDRFDLGVLAAAPLPVVLLETGAGGGWRLAWANANASSLTGRTEVELSSIDPAQWIVPQYACADGQRAQLGQALSGTDSRRFKASVLDRFGESIDALIVAESQQGPSAQTVRLLLIDTVTPECERLQGLAAGAEKARQEESARVLELAVTARELESFSYTVSHDLRSPLRIVDGFARILQEDFGAGMPPDAHTHLNRIVAASGRMNEMIDALLALARISSQPVIPEPVDLSALANGVIEELRTRDPDREVSVELQARLQCRGDRVLLRILLENLLGNAWKFSQKQASAHISFSSSLVDGATVYCVSDNGAGFDMCFAEQLFQIFRRLHSTSDFSGTGIGLATVQRIVRRHGGRVWAESESGRGARFYFTMWDKLTLDQASRPPSIPISPSAQTR